MVGACGAERSAITRRSPLTPFVNVRGLRRFRSLSALIRSADVAMCPPPVVHDSARNGLQDEGRGGPGQTGIGCIFSRPAAAAQGRVPPAALRVGDPPSPLRWTVWVGFAISTYRLNCPSGGSRSINSAGRGAVMQEVEQWPAKLGMSEYAERFAENRIDFGVLPDLTDQDLKDIGVVLGDRRKSCAQSPT